jgi:2-iminobutanoate/2-iminopropanoate deaminase
MPKHAITTDQVAQPTNPFSLGIKANGFLYTAGQIGKNLDGQIPQDFRAQVRQAMENLKAIIEAAGSTMEDVVKVNIYVTDISKMAELNEVYRSYFSGTLPARATVEVSRLGATAEVEIEAVALCD